MRYFMRKNESQPVGRADNFPDAQLLRPNSEGLSFDANFSSSDVSDQTQIGHEVTLDTSTKRSTPESNRKRSDTVRAYHAQVLDQQLTRLFGESQEEKRAGIANMYKGSRSTLEILKKLRKRGVRIEKKRFKGLRKELGIDTLKPLKGPQRGRVRQDRADLVRTARKKGFIDKLPPDMQEVLQQRYPQKGKPRRLSDIGSDMKITEERVRKTEAQALKRIKRLTEGKRQRQGGPRIDIDVNKVTRLYIEGKTEESIANIVDCSQRTISDRLIAASVPTRSGGWPRKK